MRNDLDPPVDSRRAYVDEQELSRLTTLSRTTLQTMRRKGGGPPFAKLGHRVVYRLADVERWIEQRMRCLPEASRADRVASTADDAP
jgi:predicted DNA-binding transcriptional regulator AlpA